MKTIIKILKATLVGLGGILPGVSGGMIAASFNIYEDLIEALSEFTKRPVKAVLGIWEYLVGIALGVLLGIVVIATVFTAFPIPITFLFIGLILGGIPDITKSIEKPLKWQHYLTSAIMIAIMVSLLFIKQFTVVDLGFFQYILAGFLIATSLVVPGLSGTMILLALGIYDFIMVDTIKGFIDVVFKFDIKGALALAPQIIIIGISGLVSLILLAKPINYFLKNKQTYFNMAILGILVVSPINIIFSLYKDDKYSDKFNNIGALVIISSIVLFIAGLVLALKLAKMSEKGDVSLNVE